MYAIESMEIKLLKSRLKLAIRNNPNTNQKIVASSIGISQGYLTEILSDRKEGSYKLLDKIASAAGTSLEELVCADYKKSESKNAIRKQHDMNDDTLCSVLAMINQLRADFSESQNIVIKNSLKLEKAKSELERIKHKISKISSLERKVDEIYTLLHSVLGDGQSPTVLKKNC